MQNKSDTTRQVLLIVSGGIAAYKALDLCRRLKERGCRVRAIVTRGASAFVTPLAFGAITGEKVFTELFDREDEHDIGHIRLAREADLVILAPASAHLMARMAHGLADDLASTVLLATRAPILIAPAMNPAMWAHKATQRNLATLIADGVHIIGPEAGEMAEKGEAGTGRMSEPVAIAERAIALLENREGDKKAGPLAGRHVLITAGPTHEPIDPVRYIANRSSGKQGYALARAARDAGARVTLVSGPVTLAPPCGVTLLQVETARQMLEGVRAALPADIGIFAAAVADWRVAEQASEKKKKDGSGVIPPLNLTENPDILATIAHDPRLRPAFVVGFAAETQNVEDHARQKLARKGADMIVANDVSPETGIMGGDDNTVLLVTREGTTRWPSMSKEKVGEALIQHIAEQLS